MDETSFVKKGKASVGVQRQYCGRLGKLENCQVGVFLALGRGERVAAADFRLFLPEAWAQDAKRCEKAKVPEKERRHRTKTELAMEMVVSARARGSRHGWIGGDEVYGNNDVFTAGLEDLGEVFLMDVAASHHAWTSEPKAPEQAGPRGRGRPRPSASGSNAPSRTPRASSAWPTTSCAAGLAGTTMLPWSAPPSSSP